MFSARRATMKGCEPKEEILHPRRLFPSDCHKEGEYYILVMVSLAEASGRVLKQGDTFQITDRRGGIRPLGFEQHGLFHRETRFLSRCMLRFAGKGPH